MRDKHNKTLPSDPWRGIVRYEHTKHRARSTGFSPASKANSPAVLFHERARDPQTETRSHIFFGGKERFKDPGPQLGWDAGSLVGLGTQPRRDQARPLSAELARATRRAERAEAKLAKAQKVIEIQGKVSELLEQLLAESTTEDKQSRS